MKQLLINSFDEFDKDYMSHKVDISTSIFKPLIIKHYIHADDYTLDINSENTKIVFCGILYGKKYNVVYTKLSIDISYDHIEIIITIPILVKSMFFLFFDVIPKYNYELFNTINYFIVFYIKDGIIENNTTYREKYMNHIFYYNIEGTISIDNKEYGSTGRQIIYAIFNWKSIKDRYKNVMTELGYYPKFGIHYLEGLNHYLTINY